MTTHVTNEQSLFQDDARRIFVAESIGTAAFAWMGARTLVITVDPDEWQRASASLALVQGRAADRGFKVLMQAPVAPGG